MRRIAVLAVAATVLTSAASDAQLARDSARSSKELIVVYIGSAGTDLRSGVIPMLRDMRKAVLVEAAATGRSLVFRGVSLEPPAAEAVKHLAQVADFDEISAGGNWRNLSVVHYLGNDIGPRRETNVPQLILLERDVRWEGHDRLLISPEREIKRFIGLGEISDWIMAGSRIPKL
jgi:hypothetical protein